MRILALTGIYPNPFHPTRGPFADDSLQLVSDRHDVRVIAPISWTDEVRARWRTGARLPAGRRLVRHGIIIDHPRYLYPPKLFGRWHGHCYRESVRRTFRRALAEFRPNVVYTPFAYPDGWAAVELGHQAGVPVVINVIGSDVMLLEQFPFRRRRTIDALHRADAVVAVSRSLADRVVDLGVDPGKVSVSYVGIDRETFRPGSRAEARARLGLCGDDPIILFVGNLVPVKGVDILIEAWAQLQRDRLTFRGVCVGQGPLRTCLERQVARLGLAERVRLVGPVARDQLPDWYRAASVCVLASHSEGIPVVLLEATACGTPFVATRVGGIPEIAHLGLNRLVPAGDPAALALGIRQILSTEYNPADWAQPIDRRETAESLIRTFARVSRSADSEFGLAGVDRRQPVLLGEPQ